MVVLPSFGLAHSAMAAAIEPAFEPRTGYRRLYVDLPGTGGSPAGEPRSDEVLDDVIDTVRAELGEAPFAVLGWSYGGFLAAGITRRLSSQARGLMMVCSGFQIRPESRDLSGVLPSDPGPGWLAGVPSHLHEHFAQAIGRQTAEVAQHVAAVLERNDSTDERYLSQLRSGGFELSDELMPGPRDIPACFLTGRRDRVAGYAGLFSALSRYDHADYVVSGEAGHYLPLEEPALFAAVLRNWLQRCR